MEAEQADCRGPRRVEENARADQTGRSRNAMCDTNEPIQQVGEGRIEKHLAQYRHRQHGDNQRFLDDRLPRPLTSLASHRAA